MYIEPSDSPITSASSPRATHFSSDTQYGRASDQMSATNDRPRQLQKNLAFHVSGHVLHSLFWRNMIPRGGGQPAGELALAVQESFGSFDALKSQLTEAALNVQGSGWGALAWEPVGQRLVVEQVYDHQGNIGNGTVPLLVLDMWEHAYYLQYQNLKGDWVTAFWKVVNWEDVAQRFQKVRTLDLAL